MNTSFIILLPTLLTYNSRLFGEGIDFVQPSTSSPAQFIVSGKCNQIM
jgi:hypothetical protein